MQLWNDYEGATLAGEWPLGRLLRTEGRSALFATKTGAGAPAVLRVTEALNDQPTLHARFRAIQAAGDRFLVRVERFGDAELDGTPVFWAVLEPTEESLAEILGARRLDAEETLEVAQVVAGGLLALHEQGLVHGRVEPESVLAAGGHIKLRSDCARPAPSPEQAEEDEDAVTARTDAWGLANIIHLSLTQKRLEDPADALALPEPYAAIVRNTARGQWGVPESEAELARYAHAYAAVPPPAPASTVRPESPAAPAPDPVFTAEAGSTSSKIPETTAEALNGAFSSRAQMKTAEEPAAAGSGGSRRGAVLLAAAAVVLLILFLALRHSAGKASTSAAKGSSQPSAMIGAAAPSGTAIEAAPASKASPTASTHAAASADTPANARDIWRVVAFTYNRRKEAEHKAAEINRKHPNYKAGVWSRNGERPFLVTLGGLMPHDQAEEMRTLARDSGVAPDVYAQNYSH